MVHLFTMKQNLQSIFILGCMLRLTTRENETPLKGDYVYISSEEYKDSIGELLQSTGKNRWRVRLLEFQNQVAEIDRKFLKKIDMR